MKDYDFSDETLANKLMQASNKSIQEKIAKEMLEAAARRNAEITKQNREKTMLAHQVMIAQLQSVTATIH